jgi:hypothetical protein
MHGVADSLLDQIERDALDDNASVATALRKCVSPSEARDRETFRRRRSARRDGLSGAGQFGA